MKFNAKLAGGLAWAGLAVIIAVPSADILFGTSKTRAALTSGMDAVEPAAGPVKPVLGTDSLTTASVGDPVDTYLRKNQQLPSYISDGATAPAPVKVVPVVAPAEPAEPTQVASIAPQQETPPVPMPRSMRPRSASPVVASTTPEPQPAVVTPAEQPQAIASTAPAAQPVIVDEADLARRQAAIEAVLDDGDASSQPVIEGDKLQEWDSGSLADYLAQKHLLTDSGRQPAPQAVEDNYDSSGFYLDEGPNRAQRRTSRQPPEDFFLF